MGNVAGFKDRRQAQIEREAAAEKAADAAADALSVRRRQAFIDAFIRTRDYVKSALAAGVPQWRAADVGTSMLMLLSVQRAVVLGMPEGEARCAWASKFDLDPVSANIIIEPLTLIDRIAAARTRIGEAREATQPALLIVIPKPPSVRDAARAKREAKALTAAGTLVEKVAIARQGLAADKIADAKAVAETGAPTLIEKVDAARQRVAETFAPAIADPEAAGLIGKVDAARQQIAKRAKAEAHTREYQRNYMAAKRAAAKLEGTPQHEP